MKRQSLIFEIIIFLLILIFLIIPPFFNSKITDITTLFKWSFPYRQTGLCIFVCVLYFLSSKLNEQDNKKKIFYPSLIALSLMLFTALIIKLITKNTFRTMKDILPQSGSEWAFCLLTFAFSAIYEEILYRFYFSDALKHLVTHFTSSNEKLIFWLCETAGLLVFAFAHFYLGVCAVINALVAHVVLRFLYKKTNLIWNCILIHFIYNIISLILL